MRRKPLLASTITISSLFALGLSGCVNDLLFFVAPLLT